MDVITSLTEDMVKDIRKSVRESASRGLFSASTWSAELLMSVPVRKRKPKSALREEALFTSTPANARSPPSFLVDPDRSHATTPPESPLLGAKVRHPKAPMPSSIPNHVILQEREFENAEADVLVSARIYLETRDYDPIVPLLERARSAKGRFIWLYSKYLKAETDMKKQLYRVTGWQRLSQESEEALRKILLHTINETDPWILFLKGLIQSKLGKREQAIESILLSLATTPWNWSAWEVLGECITDGMELSSICHLLPLAPSHPARQLFQVHTMNNLHCPGDQELAFCNRLLAQSFFPNSLWIMSLRAHVFYNAHDFSAARGQFEAILAIDPHRLGGANILSNIYYVTGNKVALTKLARTFLELDKDRPEICGILANHYGSRGEHAKAIEYFTRATQLDGNDATSWVLMGHELIEQKDSHAAIAAYRRAIDINRKDYRAWHGLGQTYEILNMVNLALLYYQHATALQPYDMRLWQAQAKCFEEVGMHRQAINCLKRALISADHAQSIICLSLATIHRNLGEEEQAIGYHQKVIDYCRADKRMVPEYAKSCLEVAEYHMKLREAGDLGLARSYITLVAKSNAEDVMKAADMLKDLEKLIASLSVKL